MAFSRMLGESEGIILLFNGFLLGGVAGVGSIDVPHARQELSARFRKLRDPQVSHIQSVTTEERTLVRRLSSLGPSEDSRP